MSPGDSAAPLPGRYPVRPVLAVAGAGCFALRMDQDGGTGTGGFPDIAAAGEAALLVRFGEAAAPGVSAAVAAFDAALRADPPPGMVEAVPTICSVLVRFDPGAAAPEAVEAACRERLQAADWYAAPPPPGRRRWVWPVVYGGAAGPDLAAVASRAGLREDQAIDAHAGHPLPVLMLGFAPGLVYLGGLGSAFDLPRRSALAAEVPAGSVLVAIGQTVLPATPIPTGWWRIGTAPVVNLDPDAARPFRIGHGDEVVFEPVKPGQPAAPRATAP
jgi:inhibitor of KinA